MNIVVLGAGAWGTALAIAAARLPGTPHQVTLWARDAAQVAAMRAEGENARYLQGVTLPPALRLAGDAEPWPTAALAGADLAVVVNPNNPDGREWQPQALADLARQVGYLIVDESFADPRPDLSLAPTAPDNVLILRSFGKFWGLAGVRLGFLIAAPDLIARCRAAMPPWSVSGTALEIGTRAMADLDWADAATVYHAEAGLRLDRLASLAGWHPVGGTHLFRLYDTPDAKAAQDQLAAAHVWSRIFPYSDRWVRLGVPGTRAEWDRMEQILR